MNTLPQSIDWGFLLTGILIFIGSLLGAGRNIIKFGIYRFVFS
jgi:hypothetical protein